MKDHMNSTTPSDGLTLVLGGTGKTGSRVAERLSRRGVPTRVASRSADPSFDWGDRSSWDAVLDGRNAHVCDGVFRALGREPREFATYARRSAATGVWNTTSSDKTAVAS